MPMKHGLFVNSAGNNQVMYLAIPLEYMLTVGRIQNMTFDLPGGSIGSVDCDPFFV